MREEHVRLALLGNKTEYLLKQHIPAVNDDITNAGHADDANLKSCAVLGQGLDHHSIF